MLCTACGITAQSSGPRSEYLLGTICTINLFEQGTPALYSRVFERIRELEAIFSANQEGTDLDKVNKNSGLEPVKVRPELIEVLEYALEYAEESGGAFDPTVSPLVKLWGIGTDNARVPSEEEIRKALDLINYHEVEINRTEGSVLLRRPGMALDLGAIAKGYAADELRKLLAREGVKQAIIDLGGDIFAMGEKKAPKSFRNSLKRIFSGGRPKPGDDENFWRIGIQDPRQSRGNYLGILKVKNKAVVTSGVYERFFEEAGKRYHHIFSTKSGYPVDNGLLSVTVVADNAMTADALSTSAFALGWEHGRDLIRSVPGAGGIFVYEDLSVLLTGDLEIDFTLTAAEYRIKQ